MMLYSRCTHVVPHRNVSSWAAGFAEDGLVCVRHRDPREPHWPACLAPNNQVSSPCAAMRLRRHVMCSLGSRFHAPFWHGDVRSHRTMLELWEAEFDTVCLDRSFTNRHLHACVYTRKHARTTSRDAFARIQAHALRRLSVSLTGTSCQQISTHAYAHKQTRTHAMDARM